jgi:hypothetical protein
MMIQMYFAEARIACSKGTTPYTNWGAPGLEAKWRIAL